MKKLLKIQYDGTDFSGYQVQPNRRTVQGELNSALRVLLGCDCNVTGCSRTDSGVHASAFFATAVPTDNREITIPTDNLPRALNAVLPDDISVISAYEVEDSFHPRYDVIAKEYTYCMYNTVSKDPFLRHRALKLPKPISTEQIERMNAACGYLIGEHDFASFMSEGSSVTDTTREIFYARVEPMGGIMRDDILSFRICGNGFLYNMVRIITGTLLDVAYNRSHPSDMEDIIHSKNRSTAGQTVPPHGLYLTKVAYPDDRIK